MTLPPSAHAERQSWLTRVRDQLNQCLVMVSACDLSRRSDREVFEAEQWVWRVQGFRAMPSWLRPFVSRKNETILETRRRARRELQVAAALETGAFV